MANFSAAAYSAADVKKFADSYVSVFYEAHGTNGYFKETQAGGIADFWRQAEMIECIIDAYEWTGDATYKGMITNLLNGFISNHSSSWTGNIYNDDIMWAVIAFARGGQVTDQTNYCDIAKVNFDACYSRAWDARLGGGLYWTTDNSTKNACVNGPGSIAAALLHQIYSDISYWNKATNLYHWEQSVLFNRETGKIYDAIGTNCVINRWSSTYNQGTFIGAANFLGQTNDAKLAADFTMKHITRDGILPEYGIAGNNSGFNAIFLRWMTRFMKTHNLQGNYQPWLQLNATAAWKARREVDNLSWCQWNQPSPAGTNFHAWDCISSFEALMAAEPTEDPADLSVLQPARPNIVVILTDDLGYSDLGCYGSEIATPNLDRLAKGGKPFMQFYTTPRCCPSRAALLTGLYPHQAGIGHMMEDRIAPGYRGELNDQCVTIAEALRDAGYHTSMVGKWHVTHIRFDGKHQLNFELDKPFWENQKDWPLQRGFEDYFGTIHGVNSYYDPFSLVRDNTPIEPEKDFYYTDAISDHAVADIRKNAKSDKPFFLYVAYTAPHWPLQAPAEDIARCRSKYLAGWDVIRTNRYHRMIETGIIETNWPLSPRDSRVPAWPDAPNKEWQIQRMATYAAMVERMDQGIGRILAKLKEMKIEQNTLVLFLSDNGACDEVVQPDWYDVPSKTRDGRPVKVGNNPSVMPGPEDVWQSYGVPWANVSDTPFRLYKHFVHEGGIATPFIAYWPETIQSGGTLTRQLAHVTDIMATCLDAAGASYPLTYHGHPILPMEGRSLVPIFHGEVRVDHPIFWEHEGNRAVRLGKWKLVARHPDEWELYDLEADRTEMNNLAGKHPDKAQELVTLYQNWAKRCGVLPWNQVPQVRPTKSDD